MCQERKRMAKKSKAGIEISIDSVVTKTSGKRAVTRAVSESGILEEIAEFVIKSIRDRNNPSTGKNFKQLRDVTINWRGEMEKYNPTHPDYAQAKSNLTLSGEFIDSIKAKLIKSRLSVFVRPTGSHPGYFGANGLPTRKKQPKNIDIAKGQAEMGRNILKMTDKMKKQIIEIVKRRLEEEFNN